MRIAAVQHAVPTRRITNDWILERIREYNRPRMTSLQFGAAEQRVREMLESSGTEVRYRLNEGEKAFDFGVEAATQALDAASVRPQDVDLLIYAGVVRGWLEPDAFGLLGEHPQHRPIIGPDVHHHIAREELDLCLCRIHHVPELPDHLLVAARTIPISIGVMPFCGNGVLELD